MTTTPDDPAPGGGAWEADIEKILAAHPPESPRLLLMIEAWQHGYTAGRADAARTVTPRTWNPMKQAYE